MCSQQGHCLIYSQKTSMIRGRGQYLSKNHTPLLSFPIRLGTHWLKERLILSEEGHIVGQFSKGTQSKYNK